MANKDTISINGFQHIPYSQKRYSAAEIIERSASFYRILDKRRSVRTFSDEPIPKKVIENIILSASTSPSGAHKQPWTFCAISSPYIKKEIRVAAEKEEKISYEKRMSERWKKDLEPIGTDTNKPFLETAPWLIVAFKKIYEMEDESKHNNYYVNESIGIACGLLINAIYHAGLVTLTHTPSPMNFLSNILNRPNNERPFLLFPVGYAHESCYVPSLERKSLEEVGTFYE